MEEYSEANKAKALLWVISTYGDSFTSEDPEGCALLMEAFLAGMKEENEKILDIKEFLYEEIINRREYSASKSFEIVLEEIEKIETK